MKTHQLARAKRTTEKRTPKLFTYLLALVLLLVGCNALKESEALEHVRMASHQLSTVTGLDLLAAHEEAWSFTASQSTCHYARAFMFFGTNENPQEALVIFTQLAQEYNWQVVTREGDTALDQSREFIRAGNERMIIELYEEPTTALQELFDYQKAHQQYSVIPVVQITYMLPKRTEC